MRCHNFCSILMKDGFLLLPLLTFPRTEFDLLTKKERGKNKIAPLRLLFLNDRNCVSIFASTNAWSKLMKAQMTISN